MDKTTVSQHRLLQPWMSANCVLRTALSQDEARGAFHWLKQLHTQEKPKSIRLKPGYP